MKSIFVCRISFFQSENDYHEKFWIDSISATILELFMLTIFRFEKKEQYGLLQSALAECQLSEQVGRMNLLCRSVLSLYRGCLCECCEQVVRDFLQFVDIVPIQVHYIFISLFDCLCILFLLSPVITSMQFCVVILW